MLGSVLKETRSSPPGAVGAVGHPFGSEQALSIRSADARPLRGLLSPSLLLPRLSPGCRVDPGPPRDLPPPAKIGVRSLGRTTFSSRNRSGTNPKNISQNSPIGSHYVSAVKSMHYGGTRTSNLPLNKYGIIYTRQTRILTPYVALNESAPTAR